MSFWTDYAYCSYLNFQNFVSKFKLIIMASTSSGFCVHVVVTTSLKKNNKSFLDIFTCM